VKSQIEQPSVYGFWCNQRHGADYLTLLKFSLSRLSSFAYFAKQYGLNVHPIHKGFTPSGEVLPQKLVEVVNLAKNLGLKIIYSEDLIDPRSAQAIVEEIPGAKVMMLSPIEGVNTTEQQAGITYLDKMYQDLAALKEGLQCKT
jgi:zinc transport system substrate-binding protein